MLTDLQQARDNITDDDDDGNFSVIPLLMQNKPPLSDDSTKADVEMRPDEVSKQEEGLVSLEPVHLLLVV